MLKLLVVDDEIYTKEGILEEFPWHEMGISEVFGADDGLQAYDIAQSMHPDIILTDVRMPRMDGITLAFKLREMNLQCCIIFMSGYSDKEYLKSAIQLNAISYVEKPLNSNEVRKSIEKAVKIIHEERNKNKQSLELFGKFRKSMPLIKNELALMLSRPSPDMGKVHDNLNNLNLFFTENTHLVTLLFQIIHKNASDPAHLPALSAASVEELLTAFNLNGLVGIKDTSHIIVHLYNFFDSEAFCTLTGNMRNMIHAFSEALSKSFEEIGKVNTSVGAPVCGINNIYRSYSTAVLALQKFFFYDTLKVSFYKEISSGSFLLDEAVLTQYKQCLANGEREKAVFIIKKLTSDIRPNENSLIKYVKEIYHRLLIVLAQSSLEEQIVLISEELNSNYLWESISKLDTLTLLERFIIEKSDIYFDQLWKKSQTHDVLTSILKYIQSHYSDPGLSLKDISEMSYMSHTYLCSFFKEKTGKTVNQYITDYRMEKGRELLKDVNIKISDVANRAGYNDGNYFAKIFKKITGQSPSEYREKFLCKK